MMMENIAPQPDAERAMLPESAPMLWRNWAIAPSRQVESRQASVYRAFESRMQALIHERSGLSPPFHTLLVTAIFLHLIVLAGWSIFMHRYDDTMPFETIELRLGDSDEAINPFGGFGGEQEGAAAEAGQLASEAIDNALHSFHRARSHTVQKAAALPEPSAAAAPSQTETLQAPKSDLAGNQTIKEKIAALRARQLAAAGTLDGEGNSGGAAGKGSLYGNSRAANSVEAARYEQQLSAWLERYKIYPREAKQDGVAGQVAVRVQIDRQGHVLAKWIEHGSGSDSLDRAVLEQVDRSSPMPAAPADYTGGRALEFRFLVNFDLTE